MKNDPKLKRLIQKHGVLKFRAGGDIFESLVESIISQQLAGSAANAIIGRLRGLYPKGALTPKALYQSPPSRLRMAGVSPQKIGYLKDLSSRVVKKRLVLDSLEEKSDAQLLEILDEVRGIGPWTIHMLLIFTLGRPDVLPVDDYGIRKSVQSVYSLRELPTRKRIEEIAKKWHPYCSIASLYLWKAKDSR